MRDDFLWVEKYRPRKIADAILPAELKAIFQGYVDQKNVPNLLLTGRAGVGKTTIARAMLEELQADYTIINSSLDNGINVLRDGIAAFASSHSLVNEGRKYIILDEADYLTVASQPALRNFMEQFSKGCGFILTCNYPRKIIPELHSRCKVIDFNISKEEAANIAKLFYQRTLSILKQEGIEADNKAVAGVVKKYFPDWRRVLNELQGYAASGKIDSGILLNFDETNVSQVIQLMKAKDFTSIRKWVADFATRDASEIFKLLYETSNEHIKSNTIPALVLVLAKYQYQANFAVDQQINLTACLVEIMTECQFK